MSENDTNPPGEPPEEESPPQFTLRALLLFTFLCAIYFSQSQVVEVLRKYHVPSNAALATVWVGCSVFAWFYWSNRFDVALAVHCSFPIYALVSFIMVVVLRPFMGNLPSLYESASALGTDSVTTALLANLFSFPIGVMTLVGRGLRPAWHWRIF